MGRFRKRERVGPYEIQRLLGEGGFAEAYLARDTRLKRPVVCKCPRADLAQKIGRDARVFREIKGRFQKEATAQARVVHPNVCTIFEVNGDDELIVMEYVDGQTLEDLRIKRQLLKEEIVDIAISVAEAISEAHRQNVLHRDISLRNIMLTASGRVKVLDFGLAKLKDHGPFTELAPALGTPRYTSPEQELRPRTVDERSDVFSLGVVIYRLGTGQFPYQRSFREEPSPDIPAPFSSFGIHAWPDLDRVVRCALQVNPDDRYQSMSDMLKDLIDVKRALLNSGGDLAFFDSSALLDVIAPPGPSKSGRQRAKLAQHEFEVSQERRAAVTSPDVLVELLESLTKLYFDAADRGLGKERTVQDIVAEAKREIGEERRRDARSGRMSWDALSPRERWLFARGVKSMVLPRLEALASQLVVRSIDSKVFLSRFAEWTLGSGLPEAESRRLAEACALRAEWFVSQKASYGKRPFRPLLAKCRWSVYRVGGPLDVVERGSGSPENVKTRTLLKPTSTANAV